ncbi:MAG TPA: ABC transporter permease [Vicinamibacterales bacterium]
MRFYNALLRCYPSSFRQEYGEELRAMFRRRLRDAGNPARKAAAYLGAIGDVVANAAVVHGDILRHDMKYALRTLTRTPGFALTAIAIVAVGVGATTAAFSVTDFVLLRPLPFSEPDRLIKLYERTPAYGRLELSAANYRDWKAGATVFERLGLYHSAAGNLIGAGEPLRIEGAQVDADLFPTLRVTPLIGRLFTRDDDRPGAPGTIILSYRLWQTQFGGVHSIVGQQLMLDSEAYTVIGIMPQDFRFPSAEVLYWSPVRFTEEAYQDRTDNWHYAVGRLRPGVSIEQARAELDVLAAQTRQQYPAENKNVNTNVIRLSDEVSQQSQRLLLALCGAAACVLLIACANLANLLLARALGRRRELAVRTAMGAGRDRMLRQLITESLLLSILGGAVGVLVAYSAVPLLSRLVPTTLPIASTPAVDLRVLVFALVLSCATGVAFGLVPLLRVGGEADLEGLRESARSGGGSKEGFRSALVVVEIVASIVLLVSAGLLMRALWTIQARDPGFRPQGVLTLQTPLPFPKYLKVATREDFYNRVLTDARALPGVVNAAFVSFLPMGKMKGGIWPVSFAGQSATRADNQNAFLRYVTPGYFSTFGITLKAGRIIDDGDSADRQFVAVVSDSFVARFWPNETAASAIGRHFNFALDDRVVVGVVGEVTMRGLEREAEPQVYLPSKQVKDGNIIGYVPKGLAVRTTGSPESLAPALRAIINRIDPALPVTDLVTLTDLVERDTAPRATQLRVIGAFAIIAFFLAGIGIHGLLSFAVSQRTQEIGVRMALGAQAGDILRMVIRRSVLLAIAGVIPGTALAYVAGRWMGSLLVGVTPSDALTYVSVGALAIVMTLAGTLMPAVRAVRVDPIAALRAE